MKLTHLQKEDKKKLNFDYQRELTVSGYVRVFNQSYSKTTPGVPSDINGIILKYYDLIEKRIKGLTNWLTKNGAYFHKVIIDYPEYDQKGSQPFLTLFAKELINENEQVLYIPYECIITKELARTSMVGKEIDCALNNRNIGFKLRSSHSYLASFLLQEREKQELSFWYYYLSILPNNYNNIPFNFTIAERNELIGSFTLKQCDDKLASLKTEYNNLRLHVPSYTKYNWTLEDFIWARLVVLTRIYGFTIYHVKTSGLIPMADFLYHKNDPLPTTWTYDNYKQGYVLSTRKKNEKSDQVSRYSYRIHSGNQIYNTFGRKCNSRYFVNYGFVVEKHNETLNHALIEIDFNQFRNESQFNEKINFLFQHEFTHDNPFIYNKDSDVNDERIKKSFEISIMYLTKQGTRSSTLRGALSFLRVINAKPDEFAKFQRDYPSVHPISIENEGKALKMLAYFSKQALNKFETTMAYDELLLKNYQKYPRFSNKRNIVVMRFGEKQVLNYLLKLNTVASKYLTMTREEISLKCKQISESNDINTTAFVDYFDHAIKLLVQ